MSEGIFNYATTAFSHAPTKMIGGWGYCRETLAELAKQPKVRKTPQTRKDETEFGEYIGRDGQTIHYPLKRHSRRKLTR